MEGDFEILVEKTVAYQFVILKICFYQLRPLFGCEESLGFGFLFSGVQRKSLNFGAKEIEAGDLLLF